MKHKGKLLFLGTGGSMGIPVIGCTCRVCKSSSQFNKRLRPSAIIEIEGKIILIDAGPDLRTQALNYNIQSLDGVILTHAHHDHTAGIDDLRVYNMWSGEPILCLASQETAAEIQARFKYIFSNEGYPYKLVSKINLQILEGERGEVEFLGFKLGYFSYEQAKMKVNGFRFGELGFVSDIKNYPETIFEDLKGIKKLVVSALRPDPSTIHFNFEEAIRFSEKIKPAKTWLTHLAHEVDHEEASKALPSNMFLAYDGLSIDFRM